MNASRRNWRLVAGVAVMLLALVVVGRLQGRNLPGSDAGVPRATSTTVAEATPVASGLAVAGRVALPGQPAAVAVGEGAVWVLLEEGTLLRGGPRPPPGAGPRGRGGGPAPRRAGGGGGGGGGRSGWAPAGARGRSGSTRCAYG